MTPTDIHTESATLEVASTHETGKGTPIFILGIMPRSGTNFLHRLLCQHPDCGAINTTPVREDYMLHHAGWLSRYLGRLKWQWGHWGADAAFVSPLSTSVGQGLTQFLQSLTSANRFVTKTPSVKNLKTFFRFFPHAHLLVIVRDGRSVVASGMSGFGWHFETATRQWATSAREIIDFPKQNPEFADRFKLVRYETLNANTVEELRSVLQFLNLDVDAFDFEAALNTPVYGSSFMKEGSDQVTWKPKEKDKNFNSSERWSSWSKAQHNRFNWLAGRELEALGYEPVGQVSSGPGGQFVQKLKNVAYTTRRMPRRVVSASRAGARAFRDEMRGKGNSNLNLKR